MVDGERGRRFPILFTGLNRLMVVLGILPRWSDVEVTADRVRVRLSWAFTADIPRDQVGDAVEDHGRVWGWGAHGWRGEWLVNGSSRNLVAFDVDPPARARVAGWPIRVRRLRVSVTDPRALREALATR